MTDLMPSSACSTPHKIDYFSRLPNEIVRHVVGEFDRISTTPFPPLSRRFLPEYRASLWRTVRLKGYPRIITFLLFCAHNPSITSLIECLSFNGNEDDNGHEVPPPRGAPIEQAVTNLFDRLSRLKRLVIHNCEAILSVFLRHGVVATTSLREFEVESGDESSNNPLGVKMLPMLQRYSRLTTLKIRATCRHYFSTYPLPDPLPDVTFPSLRHLDLFGRLANFQLLPSILESNKLETLKFDDLVRHSILPALLDRVGDPARVTEICLANRSDHFDPKLETSLLRFVGLKTLKLRSGCASLDPGFYRTLRQLPLEHLAFQVHAPINVPELLRFVDGEDRVKTLKSIELDCHWHYEDHDWDLIWTDFCDPHNVTELCDLAESKGVEVFGSTRDDAETWMKYLDRFSSDEDDADDDEGMNSSAEDGEEDEAAGDFDARDDSEA